MSGYAPAATAARTVSSPGPDAPRTGWFDVARVMAITAVVLIHVVAALVEGKHGVTVGSGAWWVGNALDSAARWTVPVFVMLSGALLLDPRRGMRPRELYRRRARRIGLPLAFWTAFYLVFREAVREEDLTVEQATLDILGGAPFLHLYFLYVMLGLALLTPVLRLVTAFGTRRMVGGSALAMIGLGIADQVAVYAGAGEHNAVTRFVPYVGYYLAGWYLADRRPQRRHLVLAAGLFAAAVVVTAALVRLLSHPDGFDGLGQYVYGPLSPSVAIMSLTAFPLLRAVGERWQRTAGPSANAMTERAAGLSFGVFLVHPAVLIPLQRTTGLPAQAPEVVVVVGAQLLTVLAVSFGVTALAQRVPGLRRVF